MSKSDTVLGQLRSSLRQNIGLRRASAIRAVFASPGKTTGELAKQLGERSQNIGQIFHKSHDVVKVNERWYPRGMKR